MPVTQKQIAEKLGLSQPAVAFALGGNPDVSKKLGAKTRGLIVQTARQMGYVPHQGARRLARTRASSRAKSFDQVGLIYLIKAGAHLDPVGLAMMGGAEQELSKLHAWLTFVRVVEGGDWTAVERLARSGVVDGWLVVGPANDDAVDRIKSWPQPFVVVADRHCAQPVSHVNVDNIAAGRMAAQHLAALGHRRVVYLDIESRHVYQRQTLDGFRAAAREVGLRHDEHVLGEAHLWTYSGEKDVIDWIRQLDPMPTALFVSALGAAANLHRILRSAGIEAPRDISILDYEIASPAVMSQRFTRIELPMYEVGRHGALRLHRLATGSGEEAGELKISPVLVDGGSTGPPKLATR